MRELVVLVSSAFAWGGQALSWLAPDLAVRLGLTEGPGDIDRTFLVDVRAEAVWDSFVLWTMPLAGVLLMTDHDWWPYLGLIGGGAQLYYAGRGIVVRALASIPLRGFLGRLLEGWIDVGSLGAFGASRFTGIHGIDQKADQQHARRHDQEIRWAHCRVPVEIWSG